MLSNFFWTIVYFIGQNRIRSKNTKILITVETWKLRYNYRHLKKKQHAGILRTRMKINFLVCKLVMENY